MSDYFLTWLWHDGHSYEFQAHPGGQVFLDGIPARIENFEVIAGSLRVPISEGLYHQALPTLKRQPSDRTQQTQQTRTAKQQQAAPPEEEPMHVDGEDWPPAEVFGGGQSMRDVFVDPDECYRS